MLTFALGLLVGFGGAVALVVWAVREIAPPDDETGAPLKVTPYPANDLDPFHDPDDAA